MLCIFCTQGSIEHSSELAEFFKNYGPMIVALIVGFAAWAVSAKQARIAEAKFRFDMYKDKNRIYQKIWEFLSAPLENEYRKMQEFTNMIPEARFLFGEEVALYMTLIHKKSIDLIMLLDKQKRFNPLTPAEVKQYTELLEWFLTEASNSRENFSKHFNFSTTIDKKPILKLYTALKTKLFCNIKH